MKRVRASRATRRPVATGSSPRSSATRASRVSPWRRWRRVVVVAATLATVVAGGNWLLHQSYFRVQHVRVVGAHHETVAQVVGASGLTPAVAMVSVHNGAVASGLRIFPWVQSVDVERSWPNTITLVLHERRAVAVAVGATVRLVAADGTDLGLAPVGTTLVRLVADGASTRWPFTAWARPAAHVASLLPLAFRDQVYAVHVTPAGSVSLQLTTPVIFILGRTDNLHAKFVAVASIIAHQPLQPGDRIDVSVPSAVTIQHQG